MRRPVTSTNVLAPIAAILALSCTKSGTETDNPMGPQGIELRRSSQAYLSDVNVPSTDSNALRTGVRAFALDLYREVAKRAAPEQNVCLGTNSISTVLAMTTAGARNATEAELTTVLQHGLAQNELHPAMNQLAQDLRAEFSGTAVRYDALNSIWLADDHQIEEPFLDTLSQQYDTGVYQVDFAGNAEGARDSINSWISEKTQGLIPELFGSGAITPLTELVLTNAAYLSAPWKDRFDPATTEPAEFALPDGTVVEVPMMARQWTYPFAFDVDWRALELPFNDANAGMVFVLPNEGEFTTFEASFDASTVERIVTALETSQDDVQIVQTQVPRFDFSGNVHLQPALETLGMTSAFDEATADFTGIDPRGTLYVDGFVHRTTISVDENGTTAAVATGEVMVPMPITPVISLDRPFLFFIYDHGTQTVLFVGRLVRPAGTARAPAVTAVVQTDIEAICTSLVQCTDRTTTVAECQSALAADDAMVLEQCADCIRAAAGCRWSTGYCATFSGSLCEASTCASYCPSHAF